MIVQSVSDLNRMGLPVATRFDLDSHVDLPWTPEFFGCWSGKSSLVIGRLTGDYLIEYAFKMLRRRSD